MEQIMIVRNKLGDSRTADRIPTITEFNSANAQHTFEVRKMMCSIANDISNRGHRHDHTKIEEPYRSMFYRELCDAIAGLSDFTLGEWYGQHCELERHHLNKCCPPDVNLVDVIEMIADCVCAGMARSGEVRPVVIPAEILQKAVENTVAMCKNAVTFKED